MQSISFYCAISATKYGKVVITTSIQKAKVVVTFMLGIVFLKENCTLLQLMFSIILVILSIMITKSKDIIVDKKIEKRAILYSWGFVIFNGISNFINKIYVTEFQNPLYVVFNYAIVIIIGILVYCLITKQWNYIDIRKINSKKEIRQERVNNMLDIKFVRNNPDVVKQNIKNKFQKFKCTI